MALSHVRIGIDVGEDCIVGTVLAPDDVVLTKIQVETPQKDYEATLVAVADIVNDLEKLAKLGTASVGIGFPGSLLPKTGFLQNTPANYLRGRPVRDDLTKLLRRLVLCANSGCCFALSEAINGAGMGTKSVFGTILDTRCCGGFVFNRHLLSGPRIAASEWGHNSLPWPEPDEFNRTEEPCWCGKHSCAETWISSSAIERDFAKVTGENLSAMQIIQCCENNPDAKAALDRHAYRLARSLAAIVNILDPEIIVLGGELSKISNLYTELPKLMAPYIMSQDHTVDIRRSMHGEHSKAQGAARLWEVS